MDDPFEMSPFPQRLVIKIYLNLSYCNVNSEIKLLHDFVP